MSEDNNLFDEMQKTDVTATKTEVKEESSSIADELQAVAEENSTDSVFDYNTLSDTPAVKYNRVELDKQTVTIKSAVIELPRAEVEWKLTLNKEGLFKPYTFIVEFDTENKDREFYSGLKGFKQENGNLSNPSLFRTGRNQVAKLFKAYKVFVLKSGVTDEEFEEKYGIKKFMNFLNSNPKAIMVTEDIDFQNKITRKNFVKEFI